MTKLSWSERPQLTPVNNCLKEGRGREDDDNDHGDD